MTILVFGRSGQLGGELARDPGVTALGRGQADLADPAACAAAIRSAAPAAVINAAAFTDVDRAERCEARATVINARAPGAMAAACAALGIPFVSVSTDYVFDGRGRRPWRPGDAPAPLNAYGRSKLAGERAIAVAAGGAGEGAGGAWAVLRTAWVFSAHGANFVTTMLRLGRARGTLDVVADQIGGPTPARALAMACLRVARTLISEPGKGGIHHFAGAPEVSRADFAREIFAAAGIGCAVRDIAGADYPAPAPRPLNSRLDCAATQRIFGLARPDWGAGLGDVLRELGED